MSNIAGPKVPTLFRTLADTNNRSSAQVNAVLGLKCVECAIPGEKSSEKLTLQGCKLMVAQLVIEIYSTTKGASRTELVSVFSFIKMSGRLEICLFILSDW
jgi:hypothetical protein